MTYTELLYGLSTERLREIVRRRAAAMRSLPRVKTKRELCAFLAQSLSERQSIQETLHNTNLLEIRVLVFVIVEGGSLSFEKLVVEAGEEARPRLETAVSELEASALLIRTLRGNETILVVPTAVRQHTPLPPPLRHQLPQALEQYDAVTVTQIYQNLGLPSMAITKSARAKAIIEDLTNSARLTFLVETLSEEAKKLLDYVLLHKGVSSLYELGAKLDTRQRNQLYSYDWSRRWVQGKPRNGVEELLSYGLLALVGAVGWGYGHIVIPGDVLNTLSGRGYFSGGAPKQPDWQILPGKEAPPHRHETLCRDIAYLLGYLGRTDAGRTNKDLIHRNILKSMAKGLTIPTVAYASFVYAIAREADLVGLQGKHDHYEITTQGEAWLEQPAEAQLSSLYTVWRGQGLYAENAMEALLDNRAFYHVDETRAYRANAITLLTEFAGEHPDDFVSLSSLAARAHFQWWSRFPAENSTRTAEVVAEGEFDEEEDALPPETLSPSELLSRICAESLYWLGLVETSGQPANGASFVRLSPRGCRVLAGMTEAETLQTAPVDMFIVQPNLEIYAPPNLAPRHLYRLFRVADPNSSGMLVISRDNLRRALDRGETTTGLLDFLRKHSNTGVPQNVEYLINEVGGRHGHIKVGQAGIYLQVTDPVLLQELMAQKKLGIHFRGQLGETVALVTGDSVEAILKQLRQAGYLPVAAGSPETETHSKPRKVIYAQPKPPKNLSNDVESRIDWAAIEKDAETPWQVETKAEIPPSVETNLANIQALLARAVRANLCVEIAYQAKAEVAATQRVIEPREMNGSLVHAFCRLRNDNRMFNVRYIKWARPTGEVFEPQI
jgi:hypothetical protein